jgi:hypothetical protein
VDRDVLLDTGTYFAVVSDEGETASGPSRLRVLQFHPDFARDLSELEQCRRFDGRGEDLDIYRIDPAGPGFISLTQDSDDEGFLPCLRLWDESGLNLLFGSGTCSGETTQERPLAAAYATVHDDLRNATGAYCLSQR